MPIPESQLETWSHQGSIKQSSETYGTIRAALLSAGSAYANQKFEVFLQGSYGNDTNIYAESDVDVVIRLDSCFYHDLERLPPEQQTAFHQAHPGSAPYNYHDFKRDVLAMLREKFGDPVTPGSKAIEIGANGNRRKADVLVAVEARRYFRFQNLSSESHVTGICFFRTDGTKIENFPRQHSANCTAKHQATQAWFKPTVRIFKNLRGRLIDEGLLSVGDAPSYYLEGLLYNVPNDKFGKSYQDTVLNSISWIWHADRSKFLCANEQYFLLHESSPVTWRAEQCTKFLNAAWNLWSRQ